MSVLVLLLLGSMALRGTWRTVSATSRAGRFPRSGRDERHRLRAGPSETLSPLGRLRTVLDSPWLVPVGFLLLVVAFECLVAPAVAGRRRDDQGDDHRRRRSLLVLAVVQLGRLRLPVAV